MASTSETGHAVNIANFKKIIDRCTEFGAKYNPPHAEITILNMTNKWTEASNAHSNYLIKLKDTKIPINNREILFEQLDRIVVRAHNLYECTKASKQAKKDSKGLRNKITGNNVKVKRLENNLPDPNYVSNSQQSYVKKADNFEQLIGLYKTDLNYAPNESELKTTMLETMLSNLKTANYEVGQLLAHETKYRNERNHILYDMETGMIDISLACKRYVKSLYGATSPEAKSVTGIALRRIMRLIQV